MHTHATIHLSIWQKAALSLRARSPVSSVARMSGQSWMPFRVARLWIHIVSEKKKGPRCIKDEGRETWWSKTNRRVVRALIDFGLDQSGAWLFSSFFFLSLYLFFFFFFFFFSLPTLLFEQRKDFGQRVVLLLPTPYYAAIVIPCIKKSPWIEIASSRHPSSKEVGGRKRRRIDSRVWI